MATLAPEEATLIAQIDVQHHDRGRTLSELANRLIVERKRTMPAAVFDQWLKDMEIFKRCAEHVGACQAVNEIKIALLPKP